MPTNSPTLLNELDAQYLELHHAYETAFWHDYMGMPHSGPGLAEHLERLDAYRADPQNAARVEAALADQTTGGSERESFEAWRRYFSLYSYSPESLTIKTKIAEIEARVNTEQSNYPGGYTDPDTGEFVPMPVNAVGLLIRTHSDARIRKAAHEAMETYSKRWLPELAELIRLRNALARSIGYADYYDMQARRSEGVSADRIFSIFQTVREQLSAGYDEVRALARTEPDILTPWNFVARFSGESSHASDPYFPIEESLDRWLRSMNGLGVDFSEGTVVFDPYDRAGKHRGGFCHWPTPVHYRGGVRRPATAQFTCNALQNAIGSGQEAIMTLFHEGGHAAHMLACGHPVTPYNAEYAPSSVAWAETQSMWFDGLTDSLAWRARYAHTRDGRPYTPELHHTLMRMESPLRVHDMLRISGVVELERRMYSANFLDPETIECLAREVWLEITPCDESSNRLLSIPHLYASESSCYYHGYGLALMGVAMLDQTFLGRYGHRTDCQKIASDLRAGWQPGAAIDFFDGIELVTGRPFTPDDYIDGILSDCDTRFAREQAELDALGDTPLPDMPENLHLTMRVQNGTELVADSSAGLGYMAEAFRAWTRAWEAREMQ